MSDATSMFFLGLVMGALAGAVLEWYIKGRKAESRADYFSDILQERVIRESRAIDAAIAKGMFPVKVGNFIVKDANTLTLNRSCPFAEPNEEFSFTCDCGGKIKTGDVLICNKCGYGAKITL